MGRPYPAAELQSSACIKSRCSALSKRKSYGAFRNADYVHAGRSNSTPLWTPESSEARGAPCVTPPLRLAQVLRHLVKLRVNGQLYASTCILDTMHELQSCAQVSEACAWCCRDMPQGRGASGILRKGVH